MHINKCILYVLHFVNKTIEKLTKFNGTIVMLRQFAFFLVAQSGKHGHQIKLLAQTCLYNKIYVSS